VVRPRGKGRKLPGGVFASLGRGTEFALIDFKLYLPESWAQDPERCAKAKIPEDERTYQPKWRQALELVKRARNNGVKFGWVGADALYGNNHGFINALEDAGERFMADIHCNHKLWVERPVLQVPPPTGGKRGRKPKRLKLMAGFDKSLHRRVDEICRDHFEEKSREISYRQGSKGTLTARFHTATVWVWDDNTSEPPRERTLIVREDEGGDLKYSLTNFPPDTDPEPALLD
jgi:SRSO17 transposase